MRVFFTLITSTFQCLIQLYWLFVASLLQKPKFPLICFFFFKKQWKQVKFGKEKNVYSHMR